MTLCAILLLTRDASFFFFGHHLMDRARKFGIFCLVLSTTLWAFTGIFVKSFAIDDINRYVQNFFRYFSATIGLWIIVFALFGKETLHAWRRWRSFLVPTLINCAFQTCMINAYYQKAIYPGFASLLGRLSVVFSVVLAYIFFHEERRTILSKKYIGGALIAVVGVAGVIFFKDGGFQIGAGQDGFTLGVILVIMQGFLWASYTVAMKHTLKSTRPLVAFAVVCTLSTIFFGIQTIALAKPAEILDVSPLNQFYIVLSGILCIAGAHSLYFRAIERLGVSICSSFIVVLPLIVGAFSWIFLGEMLSVGQMAMGAVLLYGGYLVVTAKGESGTPPNSASAKD
jgi:drug/metabolite transporter (DMT)-like permease